MPSVRAASLVVAFAFEIVSTLAMAQIETSKPVDCLSEKDKAAIQSMFVWQDENLKPLAFDRCDSKSLAFKIFRAVTELRDLPKLDDRRDEFNRGMLGADPYTYFRSKVRGFVFDGPQSEDCDLNTAAYYDDDPEGFIHICPQMEKSSTMQAMLLLIHEARHSEGFEHQTCSWLLKQKPRSYSCDPTYETGGAYAVAAELAVRISRSASISTELRAEARFTALADFPHRFNKLPFSMKRGLALQTERDVVLFFDGKNEVERIFEHELPHPWLTQRFGMPVLYSAESGQSKQYVFAKDLIDTRGEYSRHFREDFTVEQRAQLLDVYHGPSNVSCQLFRNELICSQSGAPDQSMKIDSFQPRRIIDLSAPGTEQSFAILTEDGRLFRLPKNLKLDGVTDRRLAVIPISHSLLDIVAIGKNRFFAIDSKGNLIRLVGLTGRPVIVDALGGVRLKRISGPITWSRDLENL